MQIQHDMFLPNEPDTKKMHDPIKSSLQKYDVHTLEFYPINLWPIINKLLEVITFIENSECYQEN